MTINLKRAYEPAVPADGYRVLADRLWPRGFSKAKAHIDLWLKDVATTHDLRKWFGHDPERWPEFRTKYQSELKNRKDLLEQLKQIELEHKAITLVHAAKDERRNNAVVLKETLGKD